jgi:hypothetical protein
MNGWYTSSSSFRPSPLQKAFLALLQQHSYVCGTSLVLPSCCCSAVVVVVFLMDTEEKLCPGFCFLCVYIPLDGTFSKIIILFPCVIILGRRRRLLRLPQNVDVDVLIYAAELNKLYI